MAATSLRERMLIKELAEQGLQDRRIAEQMQMSVHTVRKWRRKGQRLGCTGLYSRMGRPQQGALSSFPRALVAQIQGWRRSHPGWGPKTLRTELEVSGLFPGQKLPSLSALTRWVQESGAARSYHKHSELPKPAASVALACHEEWEMDARGHEKIPEVGVIALIQVNDVYSKVKLMSYPCWVGEKRLTRHPTTEDYQTVLRLAFLQWGLPERLAVDHESVFFDNLSKSPFPTRFHLWLTALGIQLTFGRMGRPTDQAMTERSHQTWQHQVLEGQRFETWRQLFQALEQRRDFLNRFLPCATLNETPPLVASPQAAIPRRPYRSEWEADLLDLSRVHAYLADLQWFRKASNVGAVSLGGQVYCLGIAWKHVEVTITFDPVDASLVFSSRDLHKRLPIQKLSSADLMGNLAVFAAKVNFQLALPFSMADWQTAFNAGLLRDMTL